MENRLLIACVLSLAVFVLWGWLMSIFQPTPPMQTARQQQEQAAKQEGAVPSAGKEKSAQKSKTQQPQASLEDLMEKPSATAEEALPEMEGTTAMESAAAEGESTAQAATPATVPAVPERTIEIDSGDLTYYLSNRGGVITSVQSRHLKSMQGEAVELVLHEEGQLYPMTLHTGNAAMDHALIDSVFSTDAPDQLVVDASNKKVSVRFELKHPTGLTVERTYTFEHGQPLFKVENKVDGAPFAKQNLQYSVLWGPGLGGAKVSQADYIIFSGPTTFVNNERVETLPDDLGPKPVTFSGDLMWTGFQNKYFASAMVPDSGIKNALVQKIGEEGVYVGLSMDSVQSSASGSFLVYVGTKELQVLEGADHKLVRLIDYGWFGNKFAFLVKPILKALNFFYGLTHNYGWSIIFLTFVIKLLFFPLTHKSFKSMKGMQKVQPYVKIIQERHKDDRQKMTQEMMDLYRKHDVSPMGGCLPMLLQIPVFIALYHALFFSIELRGAPFMLWITDLSEKDPYFVTPVIMGATMILQQKMTPTAMDPMQAKIMMAMPIVFTFLFITFPAGLVIYWIVNNVLTISQQYYIYKIAKD